MHCPQCGQQFSNEVRFCKSCGFSLDGLRELLAPTDISPALGKESRKPRLSRGRKGLYRGVIILSIGIVLLSLSGVKGNVYPLIILTCGLMRILYAMTFQEGTLRKKRQAYPPAYATPVVANRLATATGGPTLPPSLNVPVATFNARRVHTAEMVNLPSVTEHTTKLLNESQELK